MNNQIIYIRGDRNAMGTAGLVIAILSLLAAVTPIIGIVSWFMWPLSLGLSLAGVTRCARRLATNHSVAAAGVVISTMAATVCVCWVLWMLMVSS